MFRRSLRVGAVCPTITGLEKLGNPFSPRYSKKLYGRLGGGENIAGREVFGKGKRLKKGNFIEVKNG